MNKNAQRLLVRLRRLGDRDGRGDMTSKDRAAREEIDAYAAELAEPAVASLRRHRDPERRLVKAVARIKAVNAELPVRTASRNVALAVACMPVEEGGDGMKKARAARRVARTRGFVHREAFGHTALASAAEVAAVRQHHRAEFAGPIAAIRVAQIEEARIRCLEALRTGAIGVRVQAVRELASREGHAGGPYSPTRIALLAGMETAQVYYDLHKAGEGARQRLANGSASLTRAQAEALRSVGGDGRMSNRGDGRVHLNTLRALVRAGLAAVAETTSVEVPVSGRAGATRSVTEYVIVLTGEGWAARSRLRAQGQHTRSSP